MDLTVNLYIFIYAGFALIVFIFITLCCIAGDLRDAMAILKKINRNLEETKLRVGIKEERQPILDTLKQDTSWRCPNCNRFISVYSKYCSNCGQKFTEGWNNNNE